MPDDAAQGARGPLYEFEAALKRKRLLEASNRAHDEFNRREKARRKPILEMWERIGNERPRKLIQSHNGRELFAALIISFCERVRAAEYEKWLRQVTGRNDDETIALGLIVLGFDGNRSALVTKLDEIAGLDGWIRYFEDDLPGLWIIIPPFSQPAEAAANPQSDDHANKGQTNRHRGRPSQPERDERILQAIEQYPNETLAAIGRMFDGITTSAVSRAAARARARRNAR